MPDEPDTSALQRFARDLRRIREDREVTLATVHEATQAPESHLQSFEAGTLYDQPKMNPVYLRAFVRAYAEAVGIPPDPVAEQLESAFAGEYQNELAVQYLNVPPSLTEEERRPDPADAASPKGTEDDAEQSSREGEGPQEELQSATSDHPSRDADKEGESNEDVPPAPSAAEKASASPKSSAPEGHSEEKPAEQEQSVVPPSSSTRAGSPEGTGLSASAGQSGRASSEHWASRFPKTTYIEEGRRFWSEHRNVILAAVTSLLLLAGVGALVSSYLGGPDSSSDPAAQTEAPADQRPSDAPPSADTADAAEPPERRPLADLTLGDTLHVTVLATSDVRELRVQQDDHLRRPYWIEDGEAMVFPFTRRITLQNQLDSLRLLLERYPYPTSRTDDEGRIVITRDTADQFADTLRAAPVTAPVSPDTVQGDGPASDAASDADSLSLLVLDGR